MYKPLKGLLKTNFRTVLSISFIGLSVLISIIDFFININNFKPGIETDSEFVVASSLKPFSKDIRGEGEATSPALIKSSIAKATPIKIKRGDSLYHILKCASVPIGQINKSIQALREIFNPRLLNTKHELMLTLGGEINKNNISSPGASATNNTKKNTKKLDLLALVIRLSLKDEIVVEQTTDGFFVAAKRARNVRISTKSISGLITSNLYKDALDALVCQEAVKVMVNAFSYLVDFSHDLHQGDSFKIMYNTLIDEETGEERFMHVSYMSLCIKGKARELFRYKKRNNDIDYFENDGATVQRNLLKCPIAGAYVSSPYGWRKTPISKHKTFHKGVDFAAPYNTIIRAAGKGKVYKIYRSPSYGNVVILEHGNDGKAKYHTLYAHMASFAPGLRKNSRVMQGDPIGRVGATGRARGCHLHFEVWKNMVKVNPMKIKGIPVGQSLKGSQYKKFVAHTKYLKHKFMNILQGNESV